MTEATSKCERCQRNRLCVEVETGFAGESEPLCGDCISIERAGQEELLQKVTAQRDALMGVVEAQARQALAALKRLRKEAQE